jgi:hypothetical protein
MKVNITQLNQETFNRVRHQKVKNYSSQITQKDINNLLVEYVKELKLKGYTDEQISNMTFTINYVNHQNEK